MIKEAEISLPKEQLVDKIYIKESLENIKKDQEKLIERIEKAYESYGKNDPELARAVSIRDIEKNNFSLKKICEEDRFLMLIN